MSDANPDVWFSRDLPFLQYVVPKVDALPFGGITLNEAQEALGFDRETTIASARALEGEYLGMVWAMGGHGRVTAVTSEARRAAGLWPTPESIADQLMGAIDAQLASDLSDADRSRWQAIRDGAASAGRDVLVQLAAVALGTHLPR